MKIEKLKLHNFRSAADTEFEFTKQLNLFVGVNGSGKSTVLEALSICLSWLIKRIERNKGRGFYISDSSLRNGQNEASLEMSLTYDQTPYRWFLAKTAKGKSSDLESQLGEVNMLAKTIQTDHEQQQKWPILAFYSVNRLVGAVRPEISKRDTFDPLEVYKNALDGRTNYQSFFEWFRLQDDILNEKATFRFRWMQQNYSWIRYQLIDLFLYLDKLDIEDYLFDTKELGLIIQSFEGTGDPRNLLQELSFWFNVSVDFDEPFKEIHRNLGTICYIISDPNREPKKDLIEKGGAHEETITRLIRGFHQIQYEEQSDKWVIKFLWHLFNFMIHLSLWWLSDEGKQQIELEFQQWNPANRKEKKEDPTAESFLSRLRDITNEDVSSKKNSHYKKGLELQIVTNAIEQFLPNYRNLRVTRVPTPHMLIDKDGELFNLDQLSDGEKNLIALVGDIARRLAIGNPQSENPLEGEGVILIDEIDLHLHPNWQRLVIPKLLEVFPNCQFFITTHSPQVISHVEPENVFVLEQTKEGLIHRKVKETYGMSLNRVVELVMDDESRPDSVRDDLDKLFELVERKKFEAAKDLATSLKQYMPTDPELMRAEMLIRREAMKG